MIALETFLGRKIIKVKKFQESAYIIEDLCECRWYNISFDKVPFVNFVRILDQGLLRLFMHRE
jgi:hypothetical protein